MTFAAVLAICLSVATPFALADDTAKPKPVTNKTCPLMGDETNPKWRAEYQGQYVYFCCSGCVEMFKTDPEAAIAKLSAEDKAAVQKNTVCPVSNEKIESFTVRSEVDGKLVYFCCDHCKAKFDAEHATAR
jgi:YHS domain-containing protein